MPQSLSLSIIRSVVTFVACTAGFAPTLAFAAEPVQVMIVATYHFGNPGQDLNNVKAVDVLTPQRQQELDAVIAALSRFEPNKVGSEWPADVTSERYPKFLAGTLPESRNEVVQLGFRLAKARGLKEVAGLDVDGDFPFDAVQAWAKAHNRSDEIDRMLAEGQAETTKLTAMQDTSSIGGVLRYLNSPEAIAGNHAFYPPMLTMGSGSEQPGVTLLSAWYTRNLAICARLLQLTQPGDRVVVFFGQGHVYLLRQCVAESPGFELVDPLAYLPE